MLFYSFFWSWFSPQLSFELKRRNRMKPIYFHRAFTLFVQLIQEVFFSLNVLPGSNKSLDTCGNIFLPGMRADCFLKGIPCGVLGLIEPVWSWMTSMVKSVIWKLPRIFKTKGSGFHQQHRCCQDNAGRNTCESADMTHASAKTIV